MISREVTIQNKQGLHARAATYFVQKASSFKSTISVEKGEHRMNAKSLLGVLSLGINQNTTVTLFADGPDEVEALEALAELVSKPEIKQL
ncbi:MAG: HPr family phosphocarrier protein [Clostridiales bacterium]|nr:HPr family phosphocarrier protein [Clostridiales bacterium]